MNSSLSKDKINMINSILDKELSLLTVEDYGSNTILEKENYESQKPRGLTTKDFASNSNLYYDTIGKEPRDITNQGSFQRSKNEKMETFDNSARMQDDLIELQSKIVNLEKKLGNLNNGTSPPKEAEYSSSVNSQSRHYQGQSQGQGRNTKSYKSDLLDYSPLQQKYNNNNKSPLSGSKKNYGDSLRDSSVFKDVSDSSSDAHSPIPQRRTEKERKSLRQSSGKKSKLDKTYLENSIKEAQSQLDQSKSMIKRRSISRGRSGSIAKSPSTKRSGGGNADSPQEKGNYQEIIVLNKRVMELKKRRDEEKAALQTERVKNQEMAVQLEKMNTKMKKMQIELERFAKIDVDYNKLMESFEKSEYIRNQQKRLIESLQQEIEELKRYEGKASESDEAKKKKINQTKSQKKALM